MAGGTRVGVASARCAIGRCAAFAAALLAVPLIAFGAEPNWPSGSYNYVVVNQDVREVLTEFGRNLNLPVKISDRVQSRHLRGPFTVTTAGGFLKTVCETAGLVWYYDGTVLHISSSGEITTASMDVGHALASWDLRKQLQNLGVLDERYTLRTDAASGVVTVAGPPPYIATIRQSLQVIAKARGPVSDGDDKRVRVFRGGPAGS